MSNIHEKIILGSGELFLGNVENVATASEEEIEAALTKAGEIQGGATLFYTPTFKDVRGGKHNGVLASFKTQEEVRFTSGLLTWELENLNKIFPAAYSQNGSTRRVGLGGVNETKVNYLRFVHERPNGKKLTVNMFKAQNQSGFQFTFDPENESILDLEFKALAVQNKEDGNLVEIIEEI